MPASGKKPVLNKYMKPENIKTVIVGAGASGTILAGQIIEEAERLNKIITVYLIEKGNDFGPGLAYSTKLDSHILNMRADTLGVLNGNPLDFVEWLSGQPGYTSGDENLNYPPRNVYGKYLKHVFDIAVKRAASGGNAVEPVNGEVIDVDRDGRFFRVVLSDGKILTADNVVFAPGNFPSSFLSELTGIKGYLPYPWPSDQITENIERDSHVCILGTGLSAIDTLMTLKENDHRGKITFISRRGFLPKVQGEPSEYSLKFLNPARLSDEISASCDNLLSIEQVVKLFFSEMESAQGEKINWHRVLNPSGSIEVILENDIKKAESGVLSYQSALTASGPLTGFIWDNMSGNARDIFDRSWKTLWTVYRHPMPLINARKIIADLKSGQLDVQSGCLCIRTCGSDGFEIDLDTRFGVPFTIKTPYVINATGQGVDVRKYDDPLISSLLVKGLITPHPNGGICADFISSEVKKENGDRVKGIYALGEITRGVHFFTNGIVPNMDVSKRIARHILDRAG